MLALSLPVGRRIRNWKHPRLILERGDGGAHVLFAK